MERKNNELWAVVITLIAVAVVFLSTANWIAGVLNLDLRSASFILVEVLFAIAMFASVIYFDMNKRAFAPWIVVLVSPSFFPALTYWASAGPGGFHLRFHSSDMAWYGNG